MEIVAAQVPGVHDRTGLTVEQTQRSAWTVGGGGGGSTGPGGVAAGGPRAVALMLAVAWNTGAPLLVWRIPGAGWLLDRLYEVIAANRSRLPGDTPWCAAHPGGCEPVG